MNCLGYGEFENKCKNKAGGEILPKSKHWCDRCEELRRETITKQMNDILSKFKTTPIATADTGD